MKKDLMKYRKKNKIKIDPFYSKENMKRLEKSMKQMERNNSHYRDK